MFSSDIIQASIQQNLIVEFGHLPCLEDSYLNNLLIPNYSIIINIWLPVQPHKCQIVGLIPIVATLSPYTTIVPQA